MVIDGEDWLDPFSPPEPFRSGNLTPEEADDWQALTAYDSQQPFYSVDGIDRDDAKRLLRGLPKRTLPERWNYSPTIGTILRSIIEHPQVRGNKPAPSGAPDDRFGISGVLIDDPTLLTLAPDIGLGPVPPSVADLDPELRREYYHHRAGCMRSSVHRQRWYAARHRYGLHDAQHAPDEIDVVRGQNGMPVLHLWWD